MAKFKIIVGDPETGKSQSLEVEGARVVPLIGRRLGEVVDGSMVGMGGHKIQITGGSDKDGFPMRPNVHGGVRAGVVLSEGVGFHPSRRGGRRRKTLRGNVITEEIVQINMKIVEKPTKAAKPKKRKVKEKPKKTSKGKEEETTEEVAQTT